MTDQLSAAFTKRYGAPPAGIWAAPGRVNLIGEHTDYNDGFVLPFAIPQTTKVAAVARGDRTVRVTSLLDSEQKSIKFSLDGLVPGAITGWAAYVAGTFWALEDAGLRLPGMDLLIDSDVPVGAGLSSSAALECASALAATELTGNTSDRVQLAQLTQRAENEFVGVPCGILDQTASLSGQTGQAVLLDTHNFEMEPVPFAPEEQGLTLMVINSAAEHRLADGEYAARRRQCQEGAALLGIQSLRTLSDEGVRLNQLSERLTHAEQTVQRRVRHVVTENQRVLQARELLRQGRTAELGEILNASHASQRDDFEITVPETDTLVSTLLDHGALGARQMGGGFGGSVIALAPTEAADALIPAAEANAAEQGFPHPRGIKAKPSAGARKLGV